MIVLIAEKPSVAKDIARIIGATQRNDGYLSGNGYMVTWAFGHLIQLAMPEAYGVANFRRESLPILPPDFQLIPRQVKAEKGYKADPSVLKQLKVIKEVFDKCDRIIVATDAGREGELIFRYIFHYLNCRKPFVRLWISSLTDKAIREGLDNLQPGECYDNLYLSAKSRSEADWLIGINATQALSVAAGQGVFQRYKLSRRDGLHWSFARCAQMPDAESLARWEKLRTAQLERMRAKAEKQAAEK